VASRPTSRLGCDAVCGAKPLTDLAPQSRAMRVVLSLGAMVVLAMAFLPGCKTPVVTPDPPKIMILRQLMDQLPFKPTDFGPVTDYAARIDFPGVSVLPPRGRFKPWYMARWRTGETEGVAFHGRLDAQFLFALFGTAPMADRDWRLWRATQPTVFAEAVRRGSIDGSSDLPVHLRQSEANVEATITARCARYHLKADVNPSDFGGAKQGGSSGQMFVMSLYGRLCLHPDRPRVVQLMMAHFDTRKGGRHRVGRGRRCGDRALLGESTVPPARACVEMEP
jgi:hypothetical protein